MLGGAGLKSELEEASEEPLQVELLGGCRSAGQGAGAARCEAPVGSGLEGILLHFGKELDCIFQVLRL